MKDNVLPVVLFGFILAMLLYFGREYSELKYRDVTQKEVIHQLKTDASATAAASMVREKARAVEVIHQEKVHAATSKALSENQDWADGRVPDSVIDALGM